MTADACPGLRFDQQLVASWIDPGSRVLDLGCGEGGLMEHLACTLGCAVTGIELSEAKVAACVGKGLTCIQGDILIEVDQFPRGHFDYVVVSQTLQQVYNPTGLLESILRVGRRAIVSFPNFGHWRVRWQLARSGRAPKTRDLPYEWYDTPNIRVLSIRDFMDYGRRIPFSVLRSAAVNTRQGGREPGRVRLFPNLLARHGIFMIGRETAAKPGSTP